MNYLIAIVLGYAFGCFQTAFIIGKLFLKKDIRELGNGNAGASNATVEFGKSFGVITGIMDGLKALISFFILRLILKDLVDEQTLINLTYLNGLFVILGHNFPFYMGFKGGKGTATLVGLMAAIDIRLGAVALLMLIVVTLTTNYIAVGTFALLLTFIIHTLIFQPHIMNLLVVAIIVTMSVYKHRVNIVKIRNGTEKKVRNVIKS